MFDIFDDNYNPYLRGTGIPLLVDMVLLVAMYFNRKPGASLFDVLVVRPDSLTERGLRVRPWYNVTSAILFGWILVAMVLWGLRQYGLIG